MLSNFGDRSSRFYPRVTNFVIRFKIHRCPVQCKVLEINKSLVGYQRKIFEKGKTVAVLIYIQY